MLDAMNGRATIVGLALVVMLGAGCAQVKLKGGPLVTGGDGTMNWPFVPVAMRVHPFTSIEYKSTHHAVVLDARLELLDRVGDMTKGVGDLRCELYRVQARASSVQVEDEMLYVWHVEMLTLAQNRRYYDPITRTYSFQLKLDQVPPPGTAVRLYAQFTDPAGRRLEATANLTITAPDGQAVDAPR